MFATIRRKRQPGRMTNAWKGLVIYQIYPLSFLDTNRDGIGDLNGIARKIYYLRNILGVDAILINPIHASSGAEGGYDVTDYRDIDAHFGTMADFDGLLAACHQAGLKVILDWVVNHTSHEHPWFRKLEKARESPYRDYYIVRPSRQEHEPPNNWVGNFGGIAWRYISNQDEWALHSFLPEQVDLNFRNPAVLQEMGRVLEFWLDKGVDAVRLDSLPYTIKHPDLVDGKVNENYDPLLDHPSTQVITDDKWFQPGMLEVLKYLTGIASRYRGRYVISESYPPSHLEQVWLPAIYAAAPGDIHAPLNSALVSMPWEPQTIGAYLDWFFSLVRPADTAVWSIDNHDAYQRIASRAGGGQARLAAMLLLTLPGSPVIYYGDEIGMRSFDVPVPLQRDVFRRFNPGTWRTRDPSRLPMSWNGSSNAGFTSLARPGQRPWLPVALDHQAVNVRQQLGDPGSMLNLYRQLIKLRRQYTELSTGKYDALDGHNSQVLAYRLQSGEALSYVLLNFSNVPQTVRIPAPAGRLLLNTHLDRRREALLNLDHLELRGDEGVIIKLS